MAATKLTCPDCGNVMRPAKPLPAGKKVKCSECGGMFAPGDDEKPAAAAVTKMAGKGGDKKTGLAGKSVKKTEMAGKGEKQTELKANVPPAKKTKKADEPAKPKDDKTIPLADDDEDDGPPLYSYLNEGEHEEPEIDHTPDMSIKDLRGPAQEKIMKPSNYLLLYSIIGVFAYLIIAFIFLIPVCFPVPQAKGPEGSAPPAAAQQKKEEKPVSSLFMILGWDLMDTPTYPWWVVFLLVSACFLGMIYCGVVVFGGVRMQTLESRAWGIVSSIMIMMPAATLGIIGLMGIAFTNVIGLIFDDKTVYLMIPIWGIGPWAFGILVGVMNLTTLLSEDVIAGYNYVSDA